MTVLNTALAAAVFAMLSVSPSWASGADEASGQVLFKQKCAMCHGQSGMGTMLLGRRMDASEAPLEARKDLTEDYVIDAARSGVGNMPRIPRGDVSDRELSLIAAYLANRKGEKK